MGLVIHILIFSNIIWTHVFEKNCLVYLNMITTSKVNSLHCFYICFPEPYSCKYVVLILYIYFYLLQLFKLPVNELLDKGKVLLNVYTDVIYIFSSFFSWHVFTALGSLGFGAYKEEAKAVLQEAKAVAAKKRRGSSRLENLGIPEEELLRQQQELFEKVAIDIACCHLISIEFFNFFAWIVIGNIRPSNYSLNCTVNVGNIIGIFVTLSHYVPL